MRVPITNQFQVVIYLQAAINMYLQVVLTFVYKLLHVVFVLPFVYKLLHVVICLQVVTRVYNVLQVHVSTRSEITFENDVSPRSEVTVGNDVALHKTLRKNRLESNIIYYSLAICLNRFHL